MRENFTILKKLAVWIAAWYTEYCGYFSKRFWTTICSRRTKLYSLQHLKNLASSSKIGTWYWKNCKDAREWNETRTAKFVNTCTTRSKEELECMIVLAQLFLAMVWLIIRDSRFRNCILGNFLTLWNFKAGKSPSKLKDVQRQQILISQALDQRSWDSKINWRTFDIAVDCGANRVPWLQYAWWDDCVCIEKASQHADTIPKKSMRRRAACSKTRSFLTRKTNCIHDLRAFPCYWSLWSSTRTLRLIQKTLLSFR